MNRRGFTLLEVMLFLAISSGLALVAFISLGPRLRNVRFTDSVRGIEASISRAIAEANQGSNRLVDNKCDANGASDFVVSSGNSGAGGSEDCVLSGVFVFFNQAENVVNFQQVVSLREKISDTCEGSLNNEVEKLYACYRTRPLSDTESPSQKYNLTNGLEQISAGGSYVTYATNPETNQKSTFIWDGTAPVESLKVCYGLGGRKASLNFSTQSIEPKVEFNDGEC